MPCITSKRMEKIRVGTIPACIQTRELHSSEVERDVVVHICYLKMSLFAIDIPSTLVRCAKVIIPKRVEEEAEHSSRSSFSLSFHGELIRR
ncbi:Hypothetical predicted protein [Olea europaea subsp. europaea]|uniref:Uncharacterized protein n=1 Tax=Olea europaea subsp. europaea TaxID=158383 RepID=A0A8S0TI99_OLEEU|nr:Hypothetical predicted protein [Olea europaea subsp. europaea]